MLAPLSQPVSFSSIFIFYIYVSWNLWLKMCTKKVILARKLLSASEQFFLCVAASEKENEKKTLVSRAMNMCCR